MDSNSCHLSFHLIVATDRSVFLYVYQRCPLSIIIMLIDLDQLFQTPNYHCRSRHSYDDSGIYFTYTVIAVRVRLHHDFSSFR